jgi:hypothetical protein
MSAYSEWKAGLITDAEYATICRREEYEDKYFDFDDEEAFEEDDIDEW